MKTPLDAEVDLGRGHIVLQEPSSPQKWGTVAPLFLVRVYCGHGRPSQLLLTSCNDFAVFDMSLLTLYKLLFFWVNVCKAVCPMLSDRSICPVCL